jgi:hypothetical protein
MELPLVVSVPSHACVPPENSQQISGNAVLVDRGGCNFVDKVSPFHDMNRASD